MSFNKFLKNKDDDDIPISKVCGVRKLHDESLNDFSTKELNRIIYPLLKELTKMEEIKNLKFIDKLKKKSFTRYELCSIMLNFNVFIKKYKENILEEDYVVSGIYNEKEFQDRLSVFTNHKKHHFYTQINDIKKNLCKNVENVDCLNRILDLRSIITPFNFVESYKQGILLRDGIYKNHSLI